MEVCSICKRHFVGINEFLDHFFAFHSLLPPNSRENIAKDAADEEVTFFCERTGILMRVQLKDCSICGEKITKGTKIVNHIKSHIGVMPYYCDQCYFPTISKLELIQHKQTSTKCSSQQELCCDLMELHECNVCPLSFKTLFELMMHYVSHLKEMPFSCGHCKLVFLEKIDLIVHSQVHFPTQRCFLCFKTFVDHTHVLTHALTHRKSRFFQKFGILVKNKFLPIYPQEPFALLMQKKMTVARSEKNLNGLEKKTENIVEARTETKGGTSNALFNSQSFPKDRSSHGILTPVCSICKRYFVGKTKFLDHFFASHSLLPPNSHENIIKEAAHGSKTSICEKSGILLRLKDCSICSEKMSERTNIMNHIKSHIGVMPYYCNLCYFATISKPELFQHKQSRHNIFCDFIELHKCNVCPLSFKTLFQLMTHYLSHLREMPFSCGHCKLVFLEKTDLIVHSQVHFPTLDCFLCSMTFENHVDVLSHLLTHRKSRFFQKFEVQLERAFLTIYPQEPCAMQKQKEMTVVRVKSLDSFANKTANIAEMRTDPKQGTSYAIHGQRFPKHRSAGGILLPFHRGIGEVKTTKESRASGAGLKGFIFKTPNAQEIPSDNFKNKNNSKIGISDIFENQTILKPFDASANEKNNHQKSVTESLGLKTSDCINNRINRALTTTDITESKTLKFAVNNCRTVDVVENGGDPILNTKFTAADFSTDRREEFEVLKTNIKKELDEEYQEDMDYFCNVVMKDKKLGMEHFINIQKKLKSTPTNHLNKSVSNALESRLSSLRSRSRLSTDARKTAGNLSGAHKVRTRSQSNLNPFEGHSECTELQGLALKKLSVVLHKLPSHVLGMRSYRKYCRMQKLDMLRKQKQEGRSRKMYTKASVCEDQVSSKESSLGKEKKCSSRNVQNKPIKEKSLAADECSNPCSSPLSQSSIPNSKLSTSGHSYIQDTNMVINYPNTSAGCTLAALNVKDGDSTNIPGTLSCKNIVSTPSKTAKKNSNFQNKTCTKPNYESSKPSGTTGSCVLPQVQENLQKEEHRNSHRFNGNCTGTRDQTNVGQFFEIHTDGRESTTGAKENLGSSENNSYNHREKIISPTLHSKKMDSVNSKSTNHKQTHSENGAIESSPRFSSSSSNYSPMSLPNTPNRKDFNTKLKNDLSNQEEITQTDNYSGNICDIPLPSGHEHENSIVELIQHNEPAITRTSHEHESTFHRVGEVLGTPTLTRYADNKGSDVSSYDEFCVDNNKKDKMSLIDKCNTLEIEDSRMEVQSESNKSEIGYCKLQTRSRNCVKRKKIVSRNRHGKFAGKGNSNANLVQSLHVVSKVKRTFKSRNKQNTKNRVNDFITENAVDSEKTDTASSHDDFLSSDESSTDFSDHYSSRQNLPKPRRWLFPDAAKSCDLNILECSEDRTSDHLGREENFEIPQSSYYEDGNTETTHIDKLEHIPCEDSSVKDLTIVSTSSSTLFEPKIIHCESVKIALGQENEDAPALGSLKEPTKKRPKSRKARPNHKRSKIPTMSLDNSKTVKKKKYRKRSKKPAMDSDEPKTIKNIFFRPGRKNFPTQRRTTPSNQNFSKNFKKGTSRKKAKCPKRSTVVERPFQSSPEHYPVGSLKLLDLNVKLRPLPDFIYEKYEKDKPIMLSSFPLIVEETRCIHHELKRIHQIEEEHSYCVSSAKPIPIVPVVRHEHSYSSWSSEGRC